MAFVTLIAGPTASGKSALAIEIAKRNGGIVVNADSMQVYAGLCVLSARPSLEEAAVVPHHLFGFVSAGEEYSVGRYLADLAPLLHKARTSGRPLVIVGGTGLYFRAMTEGLMASPEIPAALRTEWEARASAGHDLHAELVRRDPERAASLHPSDVPRLLRAITLHAASGQTYTAWLKSHPGEPLLMPGEWRGLFINPDAAVLKARINARFHDMIELGALNEVRALLDLDPKPATNRGVMKAHGVPHLADHLRGEMPLASAIERGQGDTRAYARRQVIFARKYLASPDWRWIATAEDGLGTSGAGGRVGGSSGRRL